jgi:hypothetical protein
MAKKHKCSLWHKPKTISNTYFCMEMVAKYVVYAKPAW